MAELKEACGVFGIYDLDGGNVVPAVYYGLTALQHRGQESCGLAVSNTKGEAGNIQFHNVPGLVSEALRRETLEKMSGIILGIRTCAVISDYRSFCGRKRAASCTVLY